MKNRRIIKLTPHEKVLLRAETLCAADTIEAWARGDRVREATHIRLTRGSEKLGLPVVVAAHVAA